MKKNATPYSLDENGIVLIAHEELEEFKEIAFKEYGKKLTDEQDFQQGLALINLFNQMIKYTIENKE